MSIIQHIRDKYAAVVIGVIALSLVGFILMDAKPGNNNGGAFGDDESIGTVNGTKISYKKYKETSEQVAEYYAQQGQRPVDEDMRQQAGTQAWSQLTSMAIIHEEVERLGLQLTDKQLNDEMYVNDPPPFLKQQFTSKEGVFDASAARQALASVRKGKNEEVKAQIDNALNDYIDNLVSKKYFTLLQQSVHVPKWMVQKQLADNNAISSFQYVTVPYTTIADSTIKISDDQINDYVKKHESVYKQEEPTRGISYVTFDVKPTAADSNNIMKSIADLKSGFQTASDPAAFVTNNQTEQPYTNSYVSADRLTGQYKDTIIATGIGNVYGPYLENNAWTLSRVVDVKTLPDSVKVRHILIGTIDPQTQQPKMDDAAAKAKIDSIYNLIKGGTDFALLALQFSDDEGSKLKGGVYEFFPQGQMVPEFNDSSFQGKVGDYKIVRTQFGYHLINILAQKGSQPSYKIAYLSKSIVPSQESVNDVVNRANQFAGDSRDLKKFNDNADKAKLPKLVETNLKPMDYSVPGIGSSRQLVKWVYEHDRGDVSDAIEVGNRYVVAAITDVQEAGLPSAAKVRAEVEPLLRNREKAKQIIAKIGKPTSLEAVATAQKVTVQNADSVSFANPSIPATGPESKVVGYAFFKGALNKVSEPIDGSSGVFVIKPTSAGAKAGSVNTDELKTQMEGQLKQTLAYGAINALRKAAKIKDDRSKYL
jgi:peptidyl-prolyl cis-trans isomerase D